MISLIALSLLAVSVKADSCSGLGDWNPVQSLFQYAPAVGGAVTGNLFLNCLRAQNWIPQCTRLSSPNGLYSLVLQPDGNAVIYSSWYQSNCNYGQGCVSSTWSTSTYNTKAQAIQLMNGRFQVAQNPNANAVWDSGTQGSASGTLLCMQNDGNLVVYDGNTVVWALTH
ncbi:hypothetical protein BCR33DRAFT_722556 [Rhizoclosmatium globosum]|uniref:Bulb-type lectin domain-containing protein n=1 Tax=Rhizoclosmatium globosum TaxID=329046 RepID=A0A1Y2BKB4_9FUNG|nr:hypothetical protein BCR33DRAFT_722556 [Rhizoclosmatium globosum]|eukprot:ORY35212.1 hypothetical protein BCR33DRAFT_722556 [Rhizoclosmatium globosum]